MSDDDTVLKELVIRQRRRLVASILTSAEKTLYPHVPLEDREVFRASVFAAVAPFSDFVLDCIRSANTGWYVNDEALQLLHQINDHVSPNSDG